MTKSLEIWAMNGSSWVQMESMLGVRSQGEVRPLSGRSWIQAGQEQEWLFGRSVPLLQRVALGRVPERQAYLPGV